MADDLDLKLFEARFRKEAALALDQFGQVVLGEAQRRAPVLEGTLRASGEEQLIVEGDDVSAMISFSTPYAARQHEETEFKHPQGGEAKYLENAVKALAPRWPGYLAARLGKLF